MGDPNDPLSLNLYTYCQNDPIKYTDPTGHAVTEWDESHLTSAEITQLKNITNNYAAACAAGNYSVGSTGKGTAYWHGQAEAIRDKYRENGEHGTAGGNTVVDVPVSGAPSQYHITKPVSAPLDGQNSKKSTSAVNNNGTGNGNFIGPPNISYPGANNKPYTLSQNPEKFYNNFTAILIEKNFNPANIPNVNSLKKEIIVELKKSGCTDVNELTIEIMIKSMQLEAMGTSWKELQAQAAAESFQQMAAGVVGAVGGMAMSRGMSSKKVNALKNNLYEEYGIETGTAGDGSLGAAKNNNANIYEPSQKHNPKSGWGSADPFYNDVNAGQKAIDTAYSSSKNKQLYNYVDGKLVKFQPDSSSGKWHGYEVKNPAKEVPADVLRQMKADGLITNVEYNKFTKNK